MSKTYTIEISSEKMSQWFKSICVGGVFVLAPAACILVLFTWLFDLFNGLISPLTSVFENALGFGPIFSDAVAVLLIFFTCFATGVFVRTKLGKYMYSSIDKGFIKVAPGYKMIKGIFKQMLSDEGENPLKNGKPCLIRPYGADVDTELTGFMISHNENHNKYSVFCPSAPNPTSGYVYHVPAAQVFIAQDMTSEDALRTIIGCGMGSNELVDDALRSVLKNPEA